MKLGPGHHGNCCGLFVEAAVHIIDLSPSPDQSSPKNQTMQVPAQQEFFSVYMSAVEHVGHFWVQVLGERAGSLDLLVQSMTEYYSQPGNLQVSGCFFPIKVLPV